jgi:hypothetical protein
MSGDPVSLAAELTPYVSAAVAAYGGAVLAKARDEAADTTVSLGRRLLQRIFGSRRADEPLSGPLAVLADDPADVDALAAVRLAIGRWRPTYGRCCLRRPASPSTSAPGGTPTPRAATRPSSTTGPPAISHGREAGRIGASSESRLISGMYGSSSPGPKQRSLMAHHRRPLGSPASL